MNFTLNLKEKSIKSRKNKSNKTWNLVLSNKWENNDPSSYFVLSKVVLGFSMYYINIKKG